MTRQPRLTGNLDPRDDEHCWHPGNMMRGDGVLEMRCCFCGMTIYPEQESTPITGHGPHHPRPWTTRPVFPDEVCPVRTGEIAR